MKLETKIKRACLNQIGFVPGSGLAKFNNELVFFVSNMNNNHIVILNKSRKSTLEEQIIELFPNFDFKTDNCYQIYFITLGIQNSLAICFVDNHIEGINYYVEI